MAAGDEGEGGVGAAHEAGGEDEDEALAVEFLTMTPWPLHPRPSQAGLSRAQHTVWYAELSPIFQSGPLH